VHTFSSELWAGSNREPARLQRLQEQTQCTVDLRIDADDSDNIEATTDGDVPLPASLPKRIQTGDTFMLTPWFLAARYIGQGVAKVFSTVSDRVDAITAAHAERIVARMSERERRDYYIRDAEQRREHRRQEEAAEARRRGCLAVFLIVAAVPILLIIVHTTNSRSEQRTQEQAQEQLRATMANISKAGLNRAFALSKQYPECTAEEKSGCPDFHQQAINLCSSFGQVKPDGTGPTAECDMETSLKLWTENAALARRYDECAAQGAEAPDQCNRVIDAYGHLLQACDDPNDQVLSDCPEINQHYRNLPLR
jgi:hypothetical protein